MIRTTPHAVRLSRTIRADPDTLFRAWTDPEALRHWWRMEGEGWAFAAASIDLRVGGRYRLGMTGPDGRTYTAVGEYREVERPGRLVFTWEGWESLLADDVVFTSLTSPVAWVTARMPVSKRHGGSIRRSPHSRCET